MPARVSARSAAMERGWFMVSSGRSLKGIAGKRTSASDKANVRKQRVALPFHAPRTAANETAGARAGGSKARLVRRRCAPVLRLVRPLRRSGVAPRAAREQLTQGHALARRLDRLEQPHPIDEGHRAGRLAALEIEAIDAGHLDRAP